MPSGPIGAGEECADPSSVEAARAVLEQSGMTGNLAAQAHDRDASAYVFRPPDGGEGGETGTVLLIEDCGGAVFSRGHMLRDDAPAAVEWLGASSGSTDDGGFERQPGYLVGVVRDRNVRFIELWWPVSGEGEPGRWTTPVASGPFINAVPDDVPLGVHAGMRALDIDGEVIAELEP